MVNRLLSTYVFKYKQDWNNTEECHDTEECHNARHNELQNHTTTDLLL